MKFTPLLLLLSVLAAAPVHAQVNSLPSQPHLLVKGSAERDVTPDRFTVNLLLQRVDPAPDQARKLVQGDAEIVLKAFADHHALKDSIEASSLSVQPNSVWQDNRQVFKGSQVTRTLSATFAKLADVRGFLGVIRTSENLQISGLTTAFSGEGTLRAQLKQEAAEQSRASAQGLAKAYGARITGLYTISDVAPSFAYGVQAGTWPGDSRVYPPPPPAAPDIGASYGFNAPQMAESLEAGSVRIAENVYAIYLISP